MAQITAPQPAPTNSQPSNASQNLSVLNPQIPSSVTGSIGALSSLYSAYAQFQKQNPLLGSLSFGSALPYLQQSFPDTFNPDKYTDPSSKQFITGLNTAGQAATAGLTGYGIYGNLQNKDYLGALGGAQRLTAQGQNLGYVPDFTANIQGATGIKPANYGAGTSRVSGYAPYLTGPLSAYGAFEAFKNKDYVGGAFDSAYAAQAAGQIYRAYNPSVEVISGIPARPDLLSATWTGGSSVAPNAINAASGAVPAAPNVFSAVQGAVPAAPTIVSATQGAVPAAPNVVSATMTPGATTSVSSGLQALGVGAQTANIAGQYVLPGIGAAIGGYQIGKSLLDEQKMGTLGGTLTGAGTGAGIGTMIMPGIGTAIGAGIGALAGGVLGQVGHSKDYYRGKSREGIINALSNKTGTLELPTADGKTFTVTAEQFRRDPTYFNSRKEAEKFIPQANRILGIEGDAKASTQLKQTAALLSNALSAGVSEQTLKERFGGMAKPPKDAAAGKTGANPNDEFSKRLIEAGVDVNKPIHLIGISPEQLDKMTPAQIKDMFQPDGSNYKAPQGWQTIGNKGQQIDPGRFIGNVGKGKIPSGSYAPVPPGGWSGPLTRPDQPKWSTPGEGKRLTPKDFHRFGIDSRTLDPGVMQNLPYIPKNAKPEEIRKAVQATAQPPQTPEGIMFANMSSGKAPLSGMNKDKIKDLYLNMLGAQ